MEKHVILINGGPGVGKDTFIELCNVVLDGNMVLNESTIDPYKECAKILGGGDKSNPRYRDFLSKMKALSIEYNDFPSLYAAQMVKKFIESSEHVILFIHVREIPELDKISEMLKMNYDDTNIWTLLVKNDRVSIDTNNISDDISVSHNYNYDIVVVNNSTMDRLLISAKRLIDYLNKPSQYYVEKIIGGDDNE